ncbi:adenylyl-sulfate kinase [Paenibacillus baekrokdamisoli]|uniref:Adenylyl-sulfate kinase n=1 Tax=Paenibacillus baekrokdamisoli TaxID=1712516 RepID=A0A3G9J437_9BACL|nr:adenylyl-sulfate kinase [Paenibacillus baekrokdamisoli]MBB3072493.1 adenylylsulfate kinase [Paenibacillus baekrokdamisoli]BBH20551.1 adenylyl-sulfate kinase [Paenibacillus baekrokdamisoli]
MNSYQGSVLWFTGLSGAGKTTTAKYVEKKLRGQGRRVELLDGDDLRETICKGLGFSREDRYENVKRITYVAGLLSRNGVDVLVSAITPYNEMRAYARQQLPSYVEIYVKCPLHVCEMRDVKGLYAKARSGEVNHFTGISDPYEEPAHPALTLCTSTSTLEQNGQTILTWMDQASPQLQAATMQYWI